jgi:probable HAF family extracellular repeat protein
MRRKLAFTSALLVALGMSVALYAQDKSTGNGKSHHQYKLVDLGTLGGPTSILNMEPFQPVINDLGMVVGGADTSIPTPEPACYNPVNNPDCFISHGFVWESDHLEDLGTLSGGNFSFAEAINNRGQIAGVSENNQIDPAMGNPEFHAVLWEDEKIKDLGTLGGTSSFASELNEHGQVTGVALNAVPDSLSILGLGSGTALTQTRGFFWDHGLMHDLGTLGGPDTWAEFVNDRGQVAGTSYMSETVDPNTGIPPVGVFLWQNGKMRDLGNLGGNNGFLGAPGIVNGLNNRGEVVGNMVVSGNQSFHAFLWNGEELSDLGTFGGTFSFARGINEAGEVTGGAYFPGDQVKHGFLWRKGVMTDLGTVNGDPCSDAIAANSRGQVVGASQDAAGGCNTWSHAFLWENGGPSIDLNALIPSGSSLQLFVALGINERGEIVGGGMPRSCTDSDHCSFNHAYLLIPCDEDHPGLEGCDYDPVSATTANEPRIAEAMKPFPEAATTVSPAEMIARYHFSRTNRLRRYRALPPN